MNNEKSAPAGYVMVPVEPTQKMIEAPSDYLRSEGLVVSEWLIGKVYQFALAAAPKAEQPPVQEPVYQIHRPVDVWERHWFWVDVDKEEFDALEDATKGRILYAAPQPVGDDAKDALINQLGVALERLIATGLDQRTHHEFMTQKDNHARLAFEAYRAAMGSKGDE